MTDIWSYREGRSTHDLIGYGIEATDGSIGSIDEASLDADQGYVVVDTGAWIFGRKILLPAGVIERVDHDAEVVHVSRSKAEIKGGPDFDPGEERTRDYLDQYGNYYGGGSAPG